MANERDNAIVGQIVKLQIQYFDVNGDPIEPDDVPKFRIIDAESNVIQDYTDDDVTKSADGLYQVLYEVPSDGDLGIWSDEWQAEIGGQTLNTVFIFTVVDADEGVAPTTGPGKIRLGDDVVFNFSDEEIRGINICLKFLKARLRSTAKKPARDEWGAFLRDGYGEIITENCDVFEDEILIAFLCQSLSEFNSTPFFTGYTFADPIIQTLFYQVIVEGAYVFALASQAIVEKGRDFTVSDGGISYQPPQLGDFLQTNYSTWLTSYRERLKFIKNSIRPAPHGIGAYSNLGTASPAVLRQRHLRSRRLI